MFRRKWMTVLLLGLLHSTRFVRGIPLLTIEPTQWYTATTLTVTCDLTGGTSSRMTFYKGSSALYLCLLIGSTCGHKDGTSDYSDVDWSQTDKAIFTISNATWARDDGEWTCERDDPSPTVSLRIKDADCGSLEIKNGNFDDTGTTYGSTATISCNTGYKLYGNHTTTCQANGSWSGSIPSCKVSETNDGKEKLSFIAVVIPLVVLLIVFFIVTRYKTLVISTLNLKVTKNTVELSWQPEFEPVPNTTYAKCAQNGLTENAEFTNGSIVIEFQNLTPKRQHDVTIYCQNQADMKLYKSETFEVFTLKDSSNTNPKESKTVLSLH